jgi:hypothetical protein
MFFRFKKGVLPKSGTVNSRAEALPEAGLVQAGAVAGHRTQAEGRPLSVNEKRPHSPSS